MTFAPVVFGVALTAALSADTAVEWRCSVEGKTWERLPLHPQQDANVSTTTTPSPSPPSPPPPPLTAIYVNNPPAHTQTTASLIVKISTAEVKHEIEGFGGCFNEKGWDALSVLDDEARSSVLQGLFGEQGLRWALNRMPIGSSDFSDSYYSLDDSAGDLSMSNLSLARDEEKLLPFIKAAMRINPELTLWGVGPL
jgi:hypothetical protein